MEDRSQSIDSSVPSVAANGWIRFEDGGGAASSASDPPATIDVSQIDVQHANRSNNITDVTATPVNIDQSSSSIENGKLLATIYPDNSSLAWLVPARFNPYSMPNTLVDDRLTMTVEDYVTAMELLTNDYRFRGYTVCYRRLISVWLCVSLLILVALLFSYPKGGLYVFLLVLIWMLLVTIGLFLCICIKRQIIIGLRHCVRSANKILIRHHLLLGVEDRGKLSCHKIAIHFVYFRTIDCMSRIMQLINTQDAIAVISNASNGAGVELLVERARILILKYSQSYVKGIANRRLRFPSRPGEGVSEFVPKHCSRSMCLCQYLQKYHFERKPIKWYERIV